VRVFAALTIFNGGVTQIEPGLGMEAMEEADPECQRLKAALAAAPFGVWRR
jgi:hypothetical protein